MYRKLEVSYTNRRGSGKKNSSPSRKTASRRRATMFMPERIKNINTFIKKELGGIILKELSLPKSILVTVTEVETSRDLRQSKVFISVFPEKETKRVLRTLEKGIYDIQQILNKRLKIKFVPKIKFFEDKKLKETQKIDEILNRIEEEERLKNYRN